MRKHNTVIAVSVIAAIPLLLLLQQFLMPRTVPQPPRHLERKLDHRLLLATEEGFVYSRSSARHIAYAAAVYAAQGKHRQAELWLRLGAAEFQYPSVMHFYGDYLFSRRRYLECRRWYLMAEKQAVRDLQSSFAALVRKKIDILDDLKRRGRIK